MPIIISRFIVVFLIHRLASEVYQTNKKTDDTFDRI